MSGLLHRIAHWCFAHRWLVAAVWLVVLAATVTGAKVSGGQLDRGFTVPGSPSQIALNQVQQDFPASAGTSAQRQVVIDLAWPPGSADGQTIHVSR